MGDSMLLHLQLLYLLPSFVAIILLSLVFGIIGHFLYWLVYDSFGRDIKRVKRTLKCKNKQQVDDYHTIIIGAGFSGICTAIKLNELSMDNYVLLERHDQVGGTWYANTYPGCACDVPSNLYSYSFEPNPDWSHSFSYQPEISEYLEYCTDKYNIRRHIIFNSNVTEIRWIEEKNQWQVTADSDEGQQIFKGRTVVVGTGPLSNPNYPSDIRGIERFTGEMCHTAEWDKTINFTDKRVAVVGTGASAIQVVPEIANLNVSKLFVFQRTPPWIIPRADWVIPDWQKEFYRRVPIVQKLIRLVVYWIMESLVFSFVYRWPLRLINEKLVEYNLKRQVKDPELRRKVTPTWGFGCKRMLITNAWYPTLQKPHVELVTDRIYEITENAIVTDKGDVYPVDIIVWSTGFQTQEFPVPIYGISGYSLNQQWNKTMQAYRGVTIPNFPNLFMLLGPNTTLAHSSVVIMIEAQINYIVEAFLYMNSNNIRSIEVKEKVCTNYNRDLQVKLKSSVWQKGGCHSWYQDAQGNNTSLWPGFTWYYVLLMRNFDHQNYILQTSNVN